jgi:transcriptional regulator with XRE-family HTH domain
MTNKYDLDFIDFKRKLSLNIQYQRKLADYTQQQLSEQLDVSPNYISEMENPNNDALPSVKMIFLIAKVLNINVKDIIP